jgi:hypothetical protein
MFKGLKNLLIRIVDKYRGRPEDLKREKQKALKEAIVEGGRKSFIQELKSRIIGWFSTDKKTSTVTGLGPPVVEDLGVDLDSLLALINKELHDTVKSNMGTGFSKTILNYRTGRLAGITSDSEHSFASSIRMEGDEPIVGFKFLGVYNAFMPGGRLQKPASRRPDHLLRKSIRQIAFERANVRLKAIMDGNI